MAYKYFTLPLIFDSMVESSTGTYVDEVYEVMPLILLLKQKLSRKCCVFFLAE